MTDEPTTPDPDLEPTPPRPEGGDPQPAVTPPVAAGPPPDGVPTSEMSAATPPGAPPPKGPSWKTWAAVAGGAVVVGAAAVFGISAATSGSSNADAASQQPAVSNSAPNGYQGGQSGSARFARRPGAFGTIKSIDGSTITVSDRQQGSTTKVKTTSKTKVTTTEKGASDDVKVGDTVMVVGTQSGSSIAATRVSDDGKVSASDRRGPGAGQGFSPPQGGQGNTPPQGGEGFTPPQGGQGFNGAPPGADGNGPPQGGFGGYGGSGTSNGTSFTRGEVQSVSDGSFTVKGMDGTTTTVMTSSSTTFSITKAGSVSDLKVGDSIVATGQSKDGVVTATRIREGDMAGGFFRGGQGFPGRPNGSTGTSGVPGAGPQ